MRLTKLETFADLISDGRRQEAYALAKKEQFYIGALMDSCCNLICLLAGTVAEAAFEGEYNEALIQNAAIRRLAEACARLEGCHGTLPKDYR